jgi:ABC-type Fe3+ transport system substrate-binding protein
MKRCLFAVLLSLLVVARAAAADRLILISPHPAEVQDEFERGFQRHYRAQTGRDVTVEWLDVGGGTSSILRYIKSEFRRSPGGIGIDLFFGGGIDPYQELSQMGLCSPYRLPDEVLGRVPARIGGIPLYDPDFNWYGATLAGFGIVYNRSVLDILDLPVPGTWADLGDPKLFSWVGSGDPRSSGSVHMAYELILQAYGWERGWEVITTLGANVRNFGAGGSQAPKEVAVGEVAYALSIDFYAWAQVAEVGSEHIGFTMPDNLTIVNPDGLAILKGAPNPDVARAFVRFVMSDPGQKLWFLKRGVRGGPTTDQLNRFTVLPDLYVRLREDAAVTLNPFEWTSDLVYDSEKGSARWGVVNDLVGVMVIDSHRQLQTAWKSAAEDGVTEEEVGRLSAVPITEEECLALGPRWREPELRNRMLAAWTGFAREKYGEARKGTYFLVLDFLTLCFPFGIVAAMVVYLWRTREAREEGR